MARGTHTDGDSRDDVVASAALVLTVGAIICAALWVGTAGGAQHGIPAAMAGIAAVVCLTASIACFAAGGRDQ